MKQVIIVGIGALGSHVALFSRNWKAKIKLVDFDKVEQKNTQAQFHSRMSLRQNKALALKQAMQGLFGIKVEAVPHKLTADNADTLLAGADLVIDCTDNIAARLDIQKLVRAQGIPCIHGALSADGQFGRVVWDKDFVADAEGAEGEATCEDGEQLPFFGMAGSIVVQAAESFLKTGERRSYQLQPGIITRVA